jgi:transcriptional antiterminator RfaH
VHVDPESQSVAPVRSTIGVNDFVRFGGEMSSLGDEIVEGIRRQLTAAEASEGTAFKSGDKVEVLEGPFAGLQAVYAEPQGEKRAIILLDMLGKINRVTVEADGLVPLK